MMSELAGNLIPYTNLITGDAPPLIPSAWWLPGAPRAGFGHNDLVFVNDSGEQQESQVEPSLGDTLPTALEATWTYPFIRDHTANTPNYGFPDKYAFAKIDLGDRSAESAWNILSQVHQQFTTSGTDIKYDVDKNSNSYATTVLSVIGVDIADYATKATPQILFGEQYPFPGQGVNVLKIEGDAIALNLNGTGENDIIRAYASIAPQFLNPLSGSVGGGAATRPRHTHGL